MQPHIMTIALFVLFTIACGQKKERSSGSPSASGADESLPEVPAWASALSGTDLKYEALLDSGEEVTLAFKFEKPSVSESGKAVLVPATLSYSGAERGDAVSATALGTDGAERDIEVKNGKLPSPGAKREMTFKIPLKTSPKRLMLAAGSLRVQLEHDGSVWRTQPDEFTKRRADVLALGQCCDALKKAHEVDKAYKFAFVTCGLSMGEVIKGKYSAQETRRIVGEMVKTEKKELPAACASAETPKP